MNGELELSRTLAIVGLQYTTEVTVQEVATDDDSTPAVWLSQDPEGEVDEGTERDVVALTWAEWAEISGHVEIARGMMPDRSDESPYCGAASNRGCLCIIERTQRHKFHVDSDGSTWLNPAGTEPEF